MNKKTLPTIYYLTSLIFYVICVIKFFNSSASGGVLWLLIVSAFLYFGTNAKNNI